MSVDHCSRSFGSAPTPGLQMSSTLSALCPLFFAELFVFSRYSIPTTADNPTVLFAFLVSNTERIVLSNQKRRPFDTLSQTFLPLLCPPLIHPSLCSARLPPAFWLRTMASA
ncbi:unnamed protein product [Ectocarpus sp. 8 AP-2014]